VQFSQYRLTGLVLTTSLTTVWQFFLVFSEVWYALCTDAFALKHPNTMKDNWTIGAKDLKRNKEIILPSFSTKITVYQKQNIDRRLYII